MKILNYKIRSNGTLFKLQAYQRKNMFDLRNICMLYPSYGIISLKRNYFNLRGNSDSNSLENDKYKLIGLSEIEKLKKIDKEYLKTNKKYIDKLKLKKMEKGYLSYDTWLVIENLDISTIQSMRSILIKELFVMIKELEKDKVFSLLVNEYDEINRSRAALLPYSIFIHKGSDVMLLTNILIKYLVVHIQKYKYEREITLIFMLREWYTKRLIQSQIDILSQEIGSNKTEIQLKGELQYDSLINAIDGELKQKNIEIDDKINLNEEKFLYYRIKNLRRKCIAFRLNPYIINNLRIITGDTNYNLYSLDGFSYLLVDKSYLNSSSAEGNVTYEFTLLEINDKFDQPTKILYYIIQRKIINYGLGLIEIHSDIIYSWTDYINLSTNITRIYLNNKIEFDLASLNKTNIKGSGRKNFIKNVELAYKFPNYLEMGRDYVWDNKIGVIDLETLQINDQGEQCVYSGGWAVYGFTYHDYLDKSDINKSDLMVNVSSSVSADNTNEEMNGFEFKEHESTASNSVSNNFKLASYKLIKKLFDSIFDSDYSDFTFFAHNLGGFDYIFILSALCYYKDEYKLEPIIKEEGNLLVSLKISKKVEVNQKEKIKYNKTKGSKRVKKLVDINEEASITNKKYVRKTIKILDSNQLIPGKLRKLAKEFNCNVLKGYFPYKFININNLNYIGELPSYEYFSDSMDLEEYNIWKKSIQDEGPYDIKKNSIKYLINDLYALLEIVTKYSDNIFKNFAVNITKNKTLSGLALSIYLSSFYNSNYKLKVIKGDIEKEIRQAYFGGLVLTKKYYKHNTEAYVYDVNAHYPSAMLQDMPVGNPVLSTSNDLNSYFGFVYAEIIPPSNLDVYFIPKRDEYGNIITPNYRFNGLYFSELLKESIKYGYIINVKWGYKFERGKDVFKNYVEELYNGRLQAKLNNQNSLQLIYKLLLNSLYGRFGMKNIENKLKILSIEEAKLLMTKKNIIFYSELENKVILRYNDNVNRNIIKFVDLSNKSYTFVDNIKQRGITSSIPIAAAITSWALTSFLKYFNMDNNKLIYSDTDSATLEKPLDDKYISSTELGKMKLESVVSEAIYIAPKFYGLKTKSGEIIIKSKGLQKGKVNYQDLENLYKGEEFKTKTTVFRKNLAKGTVIIKEENFSIKGKDNLDV